MTSKIVCVSDQKWEESVNKFKERLEKLSQLLECGTSVEHGDGVELAPCSPGLWHKDIGTEHEEYTCYFRRWFRKIDGKAVTCKFGSSALMPLIRSCVWQTLLAEFVTGRLAGRDAVRLRVEEELEHHSNLGSSELRHKCGMMAQDFFGLVKNHLKAESRPLNRVGLGSAEKMVINLPGLSYRSARKGWSNLKLRRLLAQQIIEAGVGELKSRKEQEAFVYRYLSCCGELKQSAPQAILNLLKNYFDSETGETLIKGWSPEELSEIRKEAREKGCAEKLLKRSEEILSKIRSGEKLNTAERIFKSRHKELF